MLLLQSQMNMSLVNSFSMNMMVTTSGRTRTRTKGKNKKRRKSSGAQFQSLSQSQSPPAKRQTPKPKKIYTKPKKIYSVDELSKMTLAQAIQESTSSTQLLQTAQRLWLPTDKDLPPHLRTQAIHHEKRIKAASQLLQRLGDFIGVEQGINFALDGDAPHAHYLWKDAEENGLKRAILASFLPFDDGKEKSGSSSSSDTTTTSNGQKNLHISLMGLHSIVGYTLPPLTIFSKQKQNQNDTSRDNTKNAALASTSTDIDGEIVDTIREWIGMADGLAWKITMREAVEVRWAIRGILTRIDLNNNANANANANEADNDNAVVGDSETAAAEAEALSYGFMNKCIPNLNQRVSKLPFDIIPSCVDWESVQVESEDSDSDIMHSLLTDIPFQFDVITTRTGEKVQERRGTSWVVSNDSIGSLAYSGKLMQPQLVPSVVGRAMRQVEKGIIEHDACEDLYDVQVPGSGGTISRNRDYESQLQLCHEEIGEYFDCSLCNHYPNEESACKFHSDPEHGTYWERLTCVVSAGNQDVRKFAFRPIPNENRWSRYESKEAKANKSKYPAGNGNGSPSTSNSSGGEDEDIVPARIPLFPGDLVKMFAECNDVFHHAVYSSLSSGEAKKNTGDGRVSLVFKKAVDRGNGKKGHGRRGEGRRSRRYQ